MNKDDIQSVDDMPPVKAECKQQGLIGEVHKFLSSQDKFDDGRSTDHKVKRCS
jgi:hypothetical protein